jgi:UDP-glucose 4-epimerase
MSGDLAGRRVLVTGGAGFMGSHLVESLVAGGTRVTVIDSLVTGYEENLASVRDDVELRVSDLLHDDIRELLAERRFELIFHLAANATVPGSVEDPRSDFERNAIVTLNLLEAVREVSAQTRIVHTSSAAVYGDSDRSLILEKDPTLPLTPYGASKLAAESYMAVYARVYGLHTVNARVFAVYGPRLRKQVVYDLMRKIHENPQELRILGDGTQVRDFNHVANVVEALLTIAARAAFEGEVYNVAADESVSIRELAELVCAQLGANPRLVYTGEGVPGQSERWCADTTRLKKLGYRPRLSLGEGLRDTAAWFDREPAGGPAA